MMMIAAASVPLVLSMTPILDIMMFALLANHTLIFLATSPLVLQLLPLTSLHILVTLFSTQTLIILNMSRNFQLTLIMMMMIAILIFARHPPNLTTHSAWAPLTSAITETKQYSYWYHTKLDAQPRAGLLDLYVACYYCQEATFLDNEEKKQKLFTQDTKYHKLLYDMS